MSTNSVFRVTYHFETSGKRVSDEFQDNVLASGQDYNSISTVLTNNGKTNNGKGTLVIVGIGHVSGAIGAMGVLS